MAKYHILDPGLKSKSTLCGLWLILDRTTNRNCTALCKTCIKVMKAEERKK